MVEPKIKNELEWRLQQLAFEFQNVPVEVVYDMIRIAWQFAPETVREREDLPRAG